MNEPGGCEIAYTIADMKKVNEKDKILKKVKFTCPFKKICDQKFKGRYPPCTSSIDAVKVEDDLEFCVKLDSDFWDNGERHSFHFKVK